MARYRAPVEPLADECRKCGGDSETYKIRRPRHRPIMRRRKCKSCGFRWSTIEVNRHP